MKPAKQVFGALVVISLTLLSGCSSGTRSVSTGGSSGGPLGGGAASGISPEQFYTPPGAVKKALIKEYGIAPDRMMLGGFGASRPKATNDTMEGRALNRRVELVRE